MDKKLYWKNRNNVEEIEIPGAKGKPMKVKVPKPLRGQGVIEQKITPKGETLFYTTREGEKKEYPNAAGGHRAFSPRGGIIALNRKESRRRNIDRTYTASNYAAKMEQRDSNGKKINSPHKVNKPDTKPMYAAHLTNNQRMKLREIRRIELKEQKLTTV